MKKLGLYVLTVCLCSGLTACQKSPLFKASSQEEMFLQQYVDQPYYTAMPLRPFELGDDYLIDLTGDIPVAVFELSRAAVQIPLGSRITITGIDALHVLARIDGYTKQFRLLLKTRGGRVEDIAQELKLVLSETAPLQKARPEMRPFILRQEVSRGMSRQEVYMSRGQPDKVNSSPGDSGYVEEWVYFNRPVHVYLRNGFVTNWQAY